MQSNDIYKELQTNFIEYAAACNTDRAIPDAKSGLKPVTRRILWSAFKQGHTSSKPHVKCARITGEVISSLHPHGDVSVYDALVRLSQNWVMRYPLIDFHGNNGNITGDGAAHMRYTEARLSKLSEDGLLVGIKKKNVDFIPNYDEQEEEPITLPALFPNLLCNPNMGIGVAMSCNFAPHNLQEVEQAINDYLDGKEPYLPGPDFPTGGVIVNGEDIPAIMEKGKGSIKIRGKYKTERRNIVFYEIPYGLTIERVLEDINNACEKEKIDGIVEVRDESDKNGLRIVIECRRGVPAEVVTEQLFQKTCLESSFSYNQVALVDKTPTLLNLKDCIKIYVNHNLECIVREANYDLEKTQAREHIVEGLLKALGDIDNIISLIKKSKDAGNAKINLISHYNFSEEQAQAIIDMKLGRLANLEKIELEQEARDLKDKKDKLETLVNNKGTQEQELRNRLRVLVEKYGDKRRTEILSNEIVEIF